MGISVPDFVMSLVLAVAWSPSMVSPTYATFSPEYASILPT